MDDYDFVKIVDQGQDSEEEKPQVAGFSSLTRDNCFASPGKLTPPPPSKFLTGKKRRYHETSLSSLVDEYDFATPLKASMTPSSVQSKSQSPTKKRRLQINDTVEVYFYPKELSSEEEEEEDEISDLFVSRISKSEDEPTGNDKNQNRLTDQNE